MRITTGHWALRTALFSCAILAAFAWHPARATQRPAPRHLAGENLRESARYFVDFHARSKPSFPGHVFIVYGQLNARGRIIQAQVAGFTPDTDKYRPVYLIPMPGLFGQRKADFTEPSTVIYRRHLTAGEFHRLIAKVHQIRAFQPSWHLIFANCNDFVGVIARAIGLRTPPSLLLPSDYVSLLRF